MGGGREKDTGEDNTSYFTRSCIRALGARFGGVLLTYILVHIVTQHRHDLL